MANIPSPIVTGGGRQNAGSILLMSLTQGILGQLLQQGMQQFMPTPQQQAGQQVVGTRDSQERTALSDMMAIQGTPEAAAVKSAAASGAGNANVPTSQVAGIGALKSLRGSAPERLQTIQLQQAAIQEQNAVTQRQLAVEERQAKLAAEADDRMRKRFLGLVRKRDPQMVGAADMLWAAKGGGSIDTSALMQTGILPPTQKQLLDQSLAEVQLEEAKLRLGQARKDAQLRDEVAGALGLQAGTVTDAMISQWARAKDPQAMAFEMVATLVSRGVIDPLTGQAQFLSMDQVGARAEQGMGLLIPGYRLQMPEELRKTAEAAGVLEAAVTRAKTLNPSIKDAELAEQLKVRFMADFPVLSEDIFNQLFARALKANLLTSFSK